MDGLGAGGNRCRDDSITTQVAFLGGRGSEQYRLVAQLDMPGIGVSVRINSNGLHTHSTRSSGDAAGNLAAVCNQNFIEHGGNRS